MAEQSQIFKRRYHCVYMTVNSAQEFDSIYSKKIAKRYDKYEIQRLSSKRKVVRERKAGAGRRFKLDVKDRFLMLL